MLIQKFKKDSLKVEAGTNFGNFTQKMDKKLIPGMTINIWSDTAQLSPKTGMSEQVELILNGDSSLIMNPYFTSMVLPDI
jgi:hypothetical protein